MVVLTDMPTEMLWQIGSHLCYPNRREMEDGHRALSRLSRTCAYLRNALQPLVFTSFARRQPSLTQITHLLRTIDQRPDLAEHLKYIGFDNAIFLLCPLSKSGRQFCHDLFMKDGILNTDYPYELADKLYDHGSILLELLLFRTPNLIHLRIRLDAKTDLRFFHSHLVHKRTTPLLPSLRVLETHDLPGNTRRSAGPRTNNPCLGEVSLTALSTLCAAAPNLESLFTSTPCGRLYALIPSGSLFQLQNLRTLSFSTPCHVTPGVLSSIITTAAKLEVFRMPHWTPTVETIENGVARRRPGGTTAAKTWELLRLRRETLREISLDIFAGGRRSRGAGDDLEAEEEAARQPEWEMDVGRLDDEDWGGSNLGEQFPRLEVLDVGAFPLAALEEIWNNSSSNSQGGKRAGDFLAGVFPPGIREVTLRGPPREYMQRLATLAGMMTVSLTGGQRFPALERVVIAPPYRQQHHDGHGAWDEEDFWPSWRGKLQSLFAFSTRNRVRFEVEMRPRADHPAEPFSAFDLYLGDITESESVRRGRLGSHIRPGSSRP